MSHLPFSPTGSTVELAPNAGSASADLGAVDGYTVYITNPTSVLVFVKLSDTASPTAAATDTPLAAGQSMTLSRAQTQRYIAVYSAGDASGGVYAQAGHGV